MRQRAAQESEFQLYRDGNAWRRLPPGVCRSKEARALATELFIHHLATLDEIASSPAAKDADRNAAINILGRYGPGAKTEVQLEAPHIIARLSVLTARMFQDTIGAGKAEELSKEWLKAAHELVEAA